MPKAAHIFVSGLAMRLPPEAVIVVDVLLGAGYIAIESTTVITNPSCPSAYLTVLFLSAKMSTWDDAV